MKYLIVIFAFIFFPSSSIFPQVTLAAWNFPNNPDDTVVDDGIPSNVGRFITSTASGTLGYLAGATTMALNNTGWENGSGTKYWQVQFTTAGYTNLRVSSRQHSSGNGPKNFKLQYSTNSVDFVDVASGAIIVTNSVSVGGALSSLTLPEVCNNQSMVTLRWMMSSNIPLSGTVVTTEGFNRIDDIVIVGFTPVNNGDGTASIVNGNVLPLIGTNIFHPLSTLQSVKATITGVPTGTLSGFTLAIPATWGWSGNPSDVSIAADDASSLNNKVITGNGSALSPYEISFLGTITESSPARITVAGLNVPAVTGISDSGRYVFTVKTHVANGAAKPMIAGALGLVIIPMENIRKSNGLGIPLLKGKIVAVRGVTSIPDSLFVLNALNVTAQDQTGGVTIFYNGRKDILQSNIYIAKGIVFPYLGMTQINPSSGTDIIDLGPGVLSHTVLSALQFNMDPEFYEGRLVVISNSSLQSGAWPTSAITLTSGTKLIMKDAQNVSYTIFINRNTLIDGQGEPAWPRDIRGVVVQEDTLSPFLDLNTYSIAPRSYVDDFAPVNSLTSAGGATDGHPVHQFTLNHNFPNPFNPSTTITYSIPERSTVRLAIFNTLGQKISEIANEVKQAGTYEQTFNASNFSSGIYFYRIEASSAQNPRKTFVETKKMVLMK